MEKLGRGNRLGSWMKSYKAEELFDKNDRPIAESGRTGAKG